MRVFASLHLLRHALSHFLGQIVDEVLRHEQLDTVNELLVRAAVLAQDFPLFDQVNLQPQIIQGHVVPEVAIEAVGLLDQNDPNGWVPLKELDHQVEGRPARLLRCFHIDEFLNHFQTV
ncbi:MAG: hypothetical protein O7H41_17450 [Planctomycetota bacterium]|nr:hypothetical protein [Planctomycetota bacterium]